ncbi:Common central domain of tyrosinase [Luteitalea pratensis]|uniref:Common central domain of tyrosinase n=2 Tax=Luteitalea pratensis TaxID=1855912 RepID=A0A143PJ31_LUTPR|nr:Common central domain of tyrosinase [Luteitalea pratensis]
MNNPTASPFDPIFHLHHCNIDRLWAMWQVDGHATEYPLAGGVAHHHRNDLMYRWHGGAAGYGTNATIATDIRCPTSPRSGR